MRRPLVSLGRFSDTLRVAVGLAELRLAECSVACSAGLGMILPRNFAFGASPPWKRPALSLSNGIRCKRGQCTSAARRCMNSSGDMTTWVVPSLNALFSCNTTWPAQLRLSPR